MKGNGRIGKGMDGKGGRGEVKGVGERKRGRR